ncbi:hypothetical protein ACMAY7_10650 [Rhodobacteraceae bacterium nBUS_24]
MAIGSSDTGYGHLTRCYSLFSDISNLEPSRFIALTDEGGRNLLGNVSGDFFLESIHFIELLQTLNRATIVCDLLTASQDVLKCLRDTAKNLISISPVSDVNNFCDCIISRVTPKTSNCDSLYIGEHFVLLGKEILNEKRNYLTVGVNFGGSDPENKTGAFIKQISSLEFHLDLKVIVGPGFDGNFAESINDLIKNKKIMFEIIRHPHKFWAVMADCDVVFLSGGISLYEAIQRNIPSVIVSNNNVTQSLIPDNIKKNGLPLDIISMDDINILIRKLDQNREILRENIMRADYFDFKGNYKNYWKVIKSYVDK